MKSQQLPLITVLAQLKVAHLDVALVGCPPVLEDKVIFYKEMPIRSRDTSILVCRWLAHDPSCTVKVEYTLKGKRNIFNGKKF